MYDFKCSTIVFGRDLNTCFVFVFVFSFSFCFCFINKPPPNNFKQDSITISYVSLTVFILKVNCW